MKVVALSCTRNRKEALARCQTYVRRLEVPVTWIVASEDEDLFPVEPDLKVVVPKSTRPLSSFLLNMDYGFRAAMNLEPDFIAIMEDDDWYRKDHLNTVDHNKLIAQDMVYWSPWGYSMGSGFPLASWVIPKRHFDKVFETIGLCMAKDSYRVDYYFHKHHRPHVRVTGSLLMRTWVGIKGCFGDAMGGYHGLNYRCPENQAAHGRPISWIPDPDNRMLRGLVGDDADDYIRLKELQTQ